MAKIFGKNGSLSVLLNRLGKNVTWDSLSQIANFERTFKVEDEKLRNIRGQKIDSDLVDMEGEIEDLSNFYRNQKDKEEILLESEEKKNREKIYILTIKALNRNFFSRMILSFEKQSILRQQSMLLEHRDEVLRGRLVSIETEILELSNEYRKILENKNHYISSSPEVERHERIHRIIQENKLFFIGAEGEEKVLNELKKLPDSFYVLNDYRHEFNPPIYAKTDTGKPDPIISVQIDHIVIGPSGIFLIETKNWSEQTIKAERLFSPIKQLRRHGYAMFRYLNNLNLFRWRDLKSFVDYYGNRKISPREILAVVGAKPYSEYQFVKILEPERVPWFILGNKKIYNKEDIEDLVSVLSF